MTKSKASQSAVEPGVLLQLDPALILADDNTRFNLKESRIQSLAESIIAQGGVMEPVEVEPLAEANNGFTYRLTTGFYRHAAAKYLNATQAAGLLVPAMVHVNPTPVDRLKRQLVENMERENQSPMDQAIAIKKLLDAGVSKMDVRMIFSRPGGRKGNKVQPASNSFVNMTQSFLDLPKGIQEKIHSGAVGVAAAYELTKVDPEKRTAVLERAESERQRALEREEKDEEKLLAEEKKHAEATEKKAKIQEALSKTEAANKEAQDKLHKLTEQATEAFKASRAKFDTPKAKKEAESVFKTAEQARKVAEADAAQTQEEYERQFKNFTKLETAASDRAKQLKEARAAKATGAAKPSEKVGSGDVKKAAAATGASIGNVPLNASEMRKVITELCLPGSHEGVRQIGEHFRSCFSGITTDKQLYKALEALFK